MISLSDIQESFTGSIRIGEPLSKYSTLGIGGPADYYLEPASMADLVQAIQHCTGKNIPFSMITSSCNVLVNDGGYRGAVINPEPGVSRITVENNRVVAETGARIPQLIDCCFEYSLKGAEVCAGVPETVGELFGADSGDSGLDDSITEVEIIRDQKILKLKSRSSLQEGDVLLAVALRFPKGDKEELLRRRREFLLKRNQARPLNIPNVADVFKDPPGNSAAAVVSDAGFRGYSQGGAKVSELHGNLIANTGGAKAADVLDLIKTVQKSVKDKFNLFLELRLKVLGFDNEQLAEVA